MNHIRHRGDDRHFLIISNGRTGSTWLLTSLDQIPDVTARHELKWPDGTPMRADAQFVLDRETKIRDAIDTVCSRELRTVKGSKLVFNPYSYHDESVFAALADIIDEDVATILLKRRYIETWLSWKARGVYHEVNAAVAQKQIADNPMVRAMQAMEKPQTTHLVLFHNGEALAPFEKGQTPYPLETAIDDFLQFFANDMQALDIVKQRDGKVVDYSNVKQELPEIVRFVGSRSPSLEIENSVRRPLTKKLDPLQDHVHPRAPLVELSDALDEVFAQAANDTLDSRDVLQWEGEGKLRITAPAVATILEKYGFAVSGGTFVWETRKPVCSADDDPYRKTPRLMLTSRFSRDLWYRFVQGAKAYLPREQRGHRSNPERKPH